MKAADTSVVVAAFASWHEKHELARRALDAGLRLPEHCALETYSVLTRLPPPHRASGMLVCEFLTARFAEPLLRMSAKSYRDFVASLPGKEVTGGAAYDALVAAVVAENECELITCDRRAAPIYERFGVRISLL